MNPAVDPPPYYMPASVPGTWQAPFSPWTSKPNEVPEWHTPQPINKPATRPKPISPEAPDVGPKPSTDPGGWPGMPDSWPTPEPVPKVIPEVFPEFNWEPLKDWETVTMTPGLTTVHARNPATRPVRRPPKGTKEMKVRMNPVLAFIWKTFSPITETIDFINVMYECIPWKTKVAEYTSRGRQPNPAEKLQIIYRNINSIDAGCVVVNHIKEQLEDQLYALGGKHIAKANVKDNRPIGYEAGGGLSSNRPFVTVM